MYWIIWLATIECFYTSNSLVDSVIFRIHNLEVHKELVDLLHKKHLEGMSRYVKAIPKDTITEDDFMKQTQFHNFFTDHLSGKNSQ